PKRRDHYGIESKISIAIMKRCRTSMRFVPIKASFGDGLADYCVCDASSPTWRDDALERIKALPLRFDGSHTHARNINRGRGERHRGNIARAVWKDHVHLDADHQLRADGLSEQGIIAVNPDAAVDAQSLRTIMHRNEQKPDMRVDREVAEALEHAIAVVIGKCEFGRSGDANESRRAALE